jgi:hypothetical protein
MECKQDRTITNAVSAGTGVRETAASVAQADTRSGHVIGLYIDLSRATSLAGTRLCLVRKLQDGSLDLERIELSDGTPDPGPPAGMPVPHLTGVDLAAVVDALWT